MSLLHDIRKQPLHVRRTFFYLCAGISIMVVGALWFRSFRHTTYALLNPSEASRSADADTFASADSPLEFIGKLYGELRANIFGIFTNSAPTPTPASGTPAPLPLSGNR